uniref:Fibronectin type-III domain-containing protein n=1 Tax=Ditylenchus dipsaci TaxID=166011 RepID=A0A915DIM5_9BILA
MLILKADVLNDYIQSEMVVAGIEPAILDYCAITLRLHPLHKFGQGLRPSSQQATTHRVSFDSLSPYTQYRARVRGENSKGLGPFTDWISFQTLPSGSVFL